MGRRGFLLIAVIAGSVVLFFSMLGLAYSILSENMAPDDETLYDYGDFEHIGSWDALDAIEEDFFLVYLYDPDDETSKFVKNDVCAFTESYDDAFSVYFASPPLEGTPPADISETPAFLIFENGALQDIRTGEPGVYSLLDDTESGLIP